jgi:hypothetical protein
MDSRCPRKLSSLPTTPCEEGRKAIDEARKGCQGGCPYFVADRESNYCVFKYLADNGNKPVQPHRIARLLMIDDAEVKRIINNFKKILKNIEDDPVEQP